MNSKKNIPEYFPLDWHFGTDGIRGPVETTMNPLFMVKLGWAAGSVLKDEGITKILIGKSCAPLIGYFKYTRRTPTQQI